jgi:anti-sigma B factor antagonist
MPDVQQIQLEGEFDISMTGPLREQWDALIRDERPERIVIDLSRVTFIDSTGLGLLVRVLKAQRAHGGDVLVRGAVPRVMKVLSLTGLDAVFPHADAPPG